MEQALQQCLQTFHAGGCADAFEVFGCHAQTQDGVQGYVFRVWAPNAQAVSVVGDFNFWNEQDLPMRTIRELVPHGKYHFEREFLLPQYNEGKLKINVYSFHNVALFNESVLEYYNNSMRILFDSKLSQFKSPFGVLTPEEPCTIHLQIPANCRTVRAELVLKKENGEEDRRVLLARESSDELYET